MRAELRNLLWLQWRLTISMFRSRRLQLWARLGRMLLMLLMLVTSLPFFFAMGGALAFGLARLSPQGAFELTLIVNTGLLFLWLVMPTTYSSEMIERFEMSRLFVHPVSFRGLVTGSTLISLLNFIGIWSALILLGEIVGLAWHNPLMLPLVLLGAIPTLAVLLFVGRLMEDVFDLVSNDRRLRGVLVFILVLPFTLLGLGNYYLQFATRNYQNADAFFRPLVGNLPSLEGLGFTQAVDTLLVHLRLSRYLLWLPTGWGSASMALPVGGRLAAGIGFLALSLIFCAGLLGAHATIIRRLLRGARLRSATERVRSQHLDGKLPGPAVLSALFAKDWIYLRRSPVARRVLLASPFVAVAFGFAIWQVATLLPVSSSFRQALPFLTTALAMISINLSTSNLTSDYFGAVDREGFAALMLAPVDRRFVFLSSGLLTLLFALAQSVVMLVIIAVVSRNWLVLPWGLSLALCLHVSTLPAFALTSIIGAYRAKMEFLNQSQGNFWVVLAWVVASPPVVILFVVPFLFWNPGIWPGMILSVIYSTALYLVTLKPLARLLDRRTYQVLETVTGDE